MRAGRLGLLGALLTAACGGSAATATASAGGVGGQNTASAGSASGGGSAGAAPRAVIVNQFRDGPGCLPRALPTDTNSASPTFGQALCQIVESQASSCDCRKPGRAPISDPNLEASIRQQLQSTGSCGNASGQTACDSFCMCAIQQEKGAAAAACKTDPVAATADTSVPPGFCYVNDPASSAVAQCPSNQQEKIVFVSPSASPTPAPGDLLFLACGN